MYHKLGQQAAAIVAGVADPSCNARLLTLGVEANLLTSGAFGQFIADEIAKSAKVIKFANISRQANLGVCLKTSQLAPFELLGGHPGS